MEKLFAGSALAFFSSKILQGFHQQLVRSSEKKKRKKRKNPSRRRRGEKTERQEDTVDERNVRDYLGKSGIKMTNEQSAPVVGFYCR